MDELFVESLKLAMKANPSTDAAPIVGLVVLGDGKSAVTYISCIHSVQSS